mgnify:CR=1 FL=1
MFHTYTEWRMFIIVWPNLDDSVVSEQAIDSAQ